MGQPEGVVLELGQVDAPGVDLGGAAVGHGEVAGVLDDGAEDLGAPGDRLPVGVPGAGVLVVHALPVEDHRVGDVIAVDPLQQLVGLGRRLLLGHRLGEEVDPHLQAVGQGLLDIVGEIGVLVEGGVVIAPVARPDHGEVHPGGGHLGPVDLPLVGGHVDAHIAGGVPPVGEEAVLHHEGAAVIAVGGQVPRRGPRVLLLGHVEEELVIGPQDGGPLRPGGVAGVVKRAGLPAAHEAHVPGPLHRVDGPGGDLPQVGEGGGLLGQLPAPGLPEDGGHLLPGDGVVGAEGAVVIAADEPLLPGPQDGVGTGVLRVHVGEGVDGLLFLVLPVHLLGAAVKVLPLQGDHRPVVEAVQGFGQHRPGHQAVGIKLVRSGGVHQLPLHAVRHRVGVPGLGGHVGQIGPGGQGGRTGQEDAQGQRPGGQGPQAPENSVHHGNPFCCVPIRPSVPAPAGREQTDGSGARCVK